MKMILKKVSAVVLAIAVTLTAVVFDVPEKIAAEGETSSAGGCDGTHSGMTGINDASELTVSGKYYLTGDLTLSS